MFRYSNKIIIIWLLGCVVLQCLLWPVALLSKCMVFRMSLNLALVIVAVKICLTSVLDQRNDHRSWLLLYNPAIMQGLITPMVPIAMISVL